MLTRRSFTTSFLAGAAAALVSRTAPAKASTRMPDRKPSLTGGLDFPTRYRTVDIEVLPNAEFHLTDSGHCALADKSREIAGRMHDFLGRVL